jgi:hypothetical protein
MPANRAVLPILAQSRFFAVPTPVLLWERGIGGAMAAGMTSPLGETVTSDQNNRRTDVRVIYEF